MKTLLAFLYNNLDFLYLNPQYRITDSSTDGNQTVNAGIQFSGPSTIFSFVNDRGQIACAVAPTNLLSQKNWFRISIVRQYLEGLEDEKAISAEETASWVRANLGKIEGLFSDPSVTRSVDDMRTLKKTSAEKRFGPA